MQHPAEGSPSLEESVREIEAELDVIHEVLEVAQFASARGFKSVLRIRQQLRLILLETRTNRAARCIESSAAHAG